MRRKEKEITDRAELKALVGRCLVGRLGIADGDRPYVVPLSFGLEGEALYFHCASEGRKLDILARNPRVCVEFDGDVELVSADRACGWTARYMSVLIEGRAHVVADEAGKIAGLDAIMRHQASLVPKTGDGQSGDGAFRPGEYGAKMLVRTTVVRVDIESWSGKASR